MYVDAGEGVRPVGPMADELVREFEAISREIGPLPGEVAGDKRLGELLRHRATQLRAGVLAHCFFDPAEARCLDHLDEDDRREPVTGLCRLDCPRACVTRTHRPSYVKLMHEADDWARRNRIPPYAREVHRRDRDAAAAMIARIDEAARG